MGWVARDQRYPGAFVEKASGTGQTDAFAAAGDEDVLALKLQVHGL
jgi:hypothetical protein